MMDGIEIEGQGGMRVHTDKGYEDELAQLREQILFMGAKVESMVAASVRAFNEKDYELARHTIEVDHEINRLEVEIDGLCLSILARRQPVASDLRFITTTFKLVTDLERIGDLAVNICERNMEMAPDPPQRDYPNLSRMAESVQGMVHDALDAFVEKDPARAQWVIEQDRVVDSLYAHLFHEVLMVMMGDHSSVHRGMGVQAIAKHLERIGDHATNLAEQVVFLAKGQDIRHLNSLGIEEN
jgi:phosphate transport system protein